MLHLTLPEGAMLPPKQTLVPLPGKLELLRQLPPPRIIWLESVGSTHTLLKALLEESLAEGFTPSPLQQRQLEPFAMTAARRQTAGRGQRGNSWESEDYKNLSFSITYYPQGISPAEQFSISEATALAVVALLREYDIEANVKWPNDIYVGDKKICGILIDHSLLGGSIRHSIVSAGLNINQHVFVSDAPNPVSMLNISSKSAEYDIEQIATRLLQILREMLGGAESAAGRAALHKAFIKHLYRNDGRMHLYRDNIAGEEIEAVIEDVSPGGMLTLRLPNAATRTFAFKEVTFML